MKFPVHTLQTAPQRARTTLDAIVKTWGFLPNLGAVMAESPAALDLLWTGYAALNAHATLTPLEQQLICVVASRENGCAYCVAAHSTMALAARMPEDVLAAARDRSPIQDPKLSALRQTAEQLVRQRGWLGEAEKRSFLEAGYAPGQLLEIVGWLALKTLTNYTNHITGTPVDSAWRSQIWTAA